MSALETRNAIIQMAEAGASGLLPTWLERLHSDEATIDDQRKGLDLLFKAIGIGNNDKADTRVVVDIVFENGLMTTASPPVVEVQAKELLEHVATVVDVPPLDAPEPAYAPPSAIDDLLAGADDADDWEPSNV